ncbi:hypothetical protein [Aquisphaera giovannonii]|nr:hypothetical protein [Aquisphaera giovannonii]
MAVRRRLARVIIPGLCAGGACGAGVGLGLYPPAVGIAGSVAVAVLVGLAVRRLRISRPGS